MRATPEEHEAPEREGQPDVEHLDLALARDGAVALAPARENPLFAALLASAHHELRSPLQAIQGFAELLDSEAYGSLCTEQRDFLAHIVQASVELRSALDAAFSLAELELGAHTLELTQTSLPQALEAALAHARGTIHATVELESAVIHGEAALALEEFKRALAAVVKALAAHAQPVLRVRVELDGDVGRVWFEHARASRSALVGVEELARRRRACQNLVWLRLAEVLLREQGALLRVGEQLDHAEVRIRLSSPH